MNLETPNKSKGIGGKIRDAKKSAAPRKSSVQKKKIEKAPKMTAKQKLDVKMNRVKKPNIVPFNPTVIPD